MRAAGEETVTLEVLRDEQLDSSLRLVRRANDGQIEVTLAIEVTDRTTDASSCSDRGDGQLVDREILRQERTRRYWL